MRARRITLGAFTLLAAVAALAWGAEPARAVERRVAVLRLEFQGRVAEVTQDELSRRLIEGLAEAGFKSIGGSVVSQTVKKSEQCRSELCYRDNARMLGVDYLVTGAVNVDGKNYKLTLELIDGASGKTLGRSEDSCELCGVGEARNKMGRLVGTLESYANAAPPPPTRVAIESLPAGVSVTVNGEPRGATPMAIDLPTGNHRMGFSLAGYRASEQVVRVEGSGTRIVVVELVPAGAPRPTDEEAAIPSWVGWTSLGIGVAAIATGAILMATVDGTPLPLEECPKEPGSVKTTPEGTMECRFVDDVRLVSGILIGGGAGLATLGGLSLYLSPAPASPSGQRAEGLLMGARARF